jgi:hypothetical protein
MGVAVPMGTGGGDVPVGSASAPPHPTRISTSNIRLDALILLFLALHQYSTRVIRINALPEVNWSDRAYEYRRGNAQ